MQWAFLLSSRAYPDPVFPFPCYFLSSDIEMFSYQLKASPLPLEKKKECINMQNHFFCKMKLHICHSNIAKTTCQPFALWCLFNVLQSERLQGRRIIWEMILCYFKYGVGLTFLDPSYVHHTSLLLSSG